MAPQAAKRAASVYDELSLPELLTLPAGLLVLAGAALFLFNNLLRMAADFGSKAFAKQGAWQAAVQPAFAAARPVLAALFGGATGGGGLKVDLAALLLAALLIVAVGLWRSVLVATQLLRAQNAALIQAAAADDARRD